DERGERADAERLHHDERDIGGEHDEIAMRNVDEPHDAEDERQAGGEHRIEPADQHALEDDVDPLHYGRRKLEVTPPISLPAREETTSPQLRGGRETGAATNGRGRSYKVLTPQSTPPRLPRG